MKTTNFLFLFSLSALIANGADTPAIPSKDAIKKATAYIFSCDCGNSVSDPGYPESAKILRDAGPAIVPALVELVPDTTLSAWFVGNAGRVATKHPLSEPLRAALRLRREDKSFDSDPGAMLGVFEYFATFGDHTDLAWMEAAVSRLDDSRRPYATKPIQQLRERLSRK